MSLRINDVAPDFTADTSNGQISFHQWAGDNYVVLFSHPKDFTPICTTEFSGFAKASAEFTKRNTKLIGVSVDSAEDHIKWKRDIEAFGGAIADFPIVDDVALKVAKLYNMLPAEAYLPDGRTANDSATVRTVFIIGPDKKIRLTLTYPMSVGRNISEIIRALDAIQITDNAPLATPVDWVPGDDVVVSTKLNNQEAEAKYGKLDIKLPYLRFAKAPK